MPLLGKIEMERVGLGDHDHAAGIAVEAVHDPRPGRTTDIRERLKTISQRAGQRAGPVPPRRMNHHSRRLIDDHHPVVFIEHIQLDVLTDRLIAERRRYPETDRLAGAHLVTGSDHAAIDLGSASLHAVLQLLAAVAVEQLGQKDIDPQPIGRFRHGDVAKNALCLIEAVQRCVVI